MRHVGDMPESWPLVVENDDGIRPAGKPDECFYCQRKIGEDHQRNCVVVNKKVKVRWSFDVVIEVPHNWTAENVEFHYGESSWCASNAIAELQKQFPGEDGTPCPCSVFDCTYLETVDETPIREVRTPKVDG